MNEYSDWRGEVILFEDDHLTQIKFSQMTFS